MEDETKETQNKRIITENTNIKKKERKTDNRKHVRSEEDTKRRQKKIIRWKGRDRILGTQNKHTHKKRKLLIHKKRQNRRTGNA